MNVWTLVASITLAEAIVEHAVLLLRPLGSVVPAMLSRGPRQSAAVDGSTTKEHNITRDVIGL